MWKNVTTKQYVIQTFDLKASILDFCELQISLVMLWWHQACVDGQWILFKSNRLVSCWIFRLCKVVEGPSFANITHEFSDILINRT